MGLWSKKVFVLSVSEVNEILLAQINKGDGNAISFSEKTIVANWICEKVAIEKEKKGDYQ